MIQDETGKWDSLVSDYARSYVERLARTLNGTAVITGHEFDEFDALIWSGHIEAVGQINKHHFEIHNEPQDGDW